MSVRNFAYTHCLSFLIVRTHRKNLKIRQRIVYLEISNSSPFSFFRLETISLESLVILPLSQLRYGERALHFGHNLFHPTIKTNNISLQIWCTK